MKSKKFFPESIADGSTIVSIILKCSPKLSSKSNLGFLAVTDIQGSPVLFIGRDSCEACPLL